MVSRVCRGFCTCVLVSTVIYASIVHHANAQQEKANNQATIKELIDAPLIDPALPWQQLQKYVGDRIPEFQTPEELADWKDQAKQLRQDMLEKVVFRGEVRQWRNTPGRVEWFDKIETGEGYRIKKFRYEALPGYWAPALLYEPTEISGKAPIFINLNGHHRGGKAMDYKQRRCINLAKRGILAYNLEFIDMGQLHDPNGNNNHNRLVQLDLCGTSGLAPFWLVMERGLDIALEHKFADQSRVGVAGLSGGGWQTIWLVALDERITLANPVAGYGSNHVRLDYRNNVGDAEQIPSDMCLVGDYTHLTAMVAPRPLLLTNNEEDNCCFRPSEVFPRLKAAAEPTYRLYDRSADFRTHVNFVPGTHNFEKDNREALYRLVGDHFFAGDSSFDTTDIEIPEEKLNSEEELNVPMPEVNETLHSLAVKLSKSVPVNAELPTVKKEAVEWQVEARERLKELVRYESYSADSEVVGDTQVQDVAVRQMLFEVGSDWTLPAVVLSPKEFDASVILVGDEGRRTLVDKAKKYLAAGKRVLVVDLTGFGEAKGDLESIEPLLIDSVGRRALGVYASQLAAVARNLQEANADHGAKIDASGPRNSVIALVAAALEPLIISEIELHDPWGSLKYLIEENISGGDMPEMFCFGLLKHFDIAQLVALVAPRQVLIHCTDDTARREFSQLTRWYSMFGEDFQPLR